MTAAMARVSLTVLADRLISAKRQKREKDKTGQIERHSTTTGAGDSQRPFDDEVGL